jgi:hypothetical protein
MDDFRYIYNTAHEVMSQEVNMLHRERAKKWNSPRKTQVNCCCTEANPVEHNLGQSW